MKLTLAQRGVLGNYWNGEWWTAYEQRSTGSTMTALYRRKFVERRESHKPGYEYRITPAGRAALVEA